MSQVNPARTIAFETFCITLKQVMGESLITEIRFRDMWLEHMRQDTDISLDGWYSPPPSGIAVLFANEDKPGRISFRSLRDQKYWPTDRVIDWDTGLLYAYCSPVFIPKGLPGDFAVTLYFGKDPTIIAHFKNAYVATKEVIAAVTDCSNSSQLCRLSQSIFENHGLHNTVVSVTDEAKLGIGHGLPTISPEFFCNGRAITDKIIDKLCRSRLFINNIANWALESAGQITLEPQLMSLNNPDLPQVSFHYIVSFKNSLQVLTEPDGLLAQFSLI